VWVIIFNSPPLVFLQTHYHFNAAAWCFSPADRTTKANKLFYFYFMISPYPTEWPSFYTATIFKWYPLLSDDKYKEIILDSLRFLVNNKRIELSAFVIMSNHIHLIWQIQPASTPTSVQLSFMKFTAQQIKFSLIKKDPELIEKYKVNLFDRKYQFWKREPLSIQLFTPKVFEQKINYIHYNR